MIKLKNKSDIEKIRESASILKETMSFLKEDIKEGNTTDSLNELALKKISGLGANPAFLGYMNYPAAICTSINEEVIHGIPSRRELVSGDIISIDIGVEKDGYYSDAAVTFPVGKVTDELDSLIKVTRESLLTGINNVANRSRIKDVSSAIYEYADNRGFGVVRQYCGHGVGFSLHEEPQISNYPGNSENQRLKAGMVLAIEPMLNIGSWEVDVLQDGWTVVTSDHKASAHFEHTVAVFEDHTEILTDFD